ncbi:iron-containing alcohol dehydrogenase [Pseudonocardia sp. MH-G8]|uniref:iron-containing alcohol dehydrogenase n=1 Tax=Pseudonocardia sp. MH-G8 TaxID=1854588 RepID=UPI001E3D8E80|nr:iron-containing alcohol dehydrogenase [Pseudonocardia sp. MH-G8]
MTPAAVGVTAPTGELDGLSAFAYESLPMRVVFGSGCVARIVDEVAGLGLSRVLVLCSPEQRGLGREVADVLGQASVGVFDGARMHVPVGVATAGTSEARSRDADGCVAVGGGSAIGLGKAIALETGLPLLCIPTTYSGSEMTPVWGLTANGDKLTGRDLSVLPRAVIYDPDLTLGLPHAPTHAVVLPHVAAFNLPAAPHAAAALGRALGTDDPAAALAGLNVTLGPPSRPCGPSAWTAKTLPPQPMLSLPVPTAIRGP